MQHRRAVLEILVRALLACCVMGAAHALRVSMCSSQSRTRRAAVQRVAVSIAALSTTPAIAAYEYMPGLAGKDYGKQRTIYPDFTLSPSGLQTKDVRVGTGKSPTVGDRVVLDWEGYTIGYYGRPFEAKHKVKGGAFDADEKDLYRFVMGQGTAIKGLEEALATMKEGGIRQLIIPPELGYPSSDPDHDKVGPKPSTFSGQRALNFVLQNKGLIDKTLLINIELKRVDKPGERGLKFKKQTP